MKAKDLANAISLLAALKDPDWLRGKLAELQREKTDADAAIEEMRSIAAGIEVSEKALQELLADHARQEQSLNGRDARLKDAEQQWQFFMEADRKALADTKAAHNALVEETKAAAIRQADVLDKRSKELDQREKALAKRELAAVKKDDELVRREQALTTQQAVQAAREQKIREAMTDG